MSDVVVDASVAAAWLLPDERTDATEALLDDMSSMKAFVPSIFWHEIRNILILAERRQRIRAHQTPQLIVRLEMLKLLDGGHGRHAVILSLASIHGLTAYDSAYLDLAMSLRSSLMTLDKKLAAAAGRENVAVLGPLAS